MDKVVLLIDKTSNQNWKKTLKPFYFLFFLFGILVAGCSLVPMQEAGSQAFAEAVCLYDKKIGRESAKFNKCLADQAR